MPLAPGLTGEFEQIVTRELTADALGNKGVQVFATPFVINLMELTCNVAMKPHLPTGASSVGTMVEMKHQAATPVGMKVRGKATLLRDLGVDIGRILHGEQEFEHFKPILPGRTYLCRGRITDIYEKTGKSGPMAFVVRETTITDGDNDIVCVTRQ